MAGITPFVVEVTDAKLSRMLQLARDAAATLQDFGEHILAEDVSTDDFKYGVPPTSLKRLVDYLNTGYDWRKHERIINEMPQFLLTVSNPPFEDELKIHFIHKRSDKENALPLVSLRIVSGSSGWAYVSYSFCRTAGRKHHSRVRGHW